MNEAINKVNKATVRAHRIGGKTEKAVKGAIHDAVKTAEDIFERTVKNAIHRTEAAAARANKAAAKVEVISRMLDAEFKRTQQAARAFRTAADGLVAKTKKKDPLSARYIIWLEKQLIKEAKEKERRAKD